MKKKLIASLIAVVAPAIIQASGMSVYVPYTFEHSVTGSGHSDSYYDWGSSAYMPAVDYDIDYKLKSKVGDIGLAFSTNVGKDKLFGYSIALEMKKPQGTTSDDTFTRYDMLHTFEFGLLRTETVRLWAGPRINLAISNYSKDDFNRDGRELGLAAAFGLNVNFGEYFAINSSLDYKMGWQQGEYTFTTPTGNFINGNYDETHTGATFRLGVTYKFGEEFYQGEY